MGDTVARGAPLRTVVLLPPGLGPVGKRAGDPGASVPTTKTTNATSDTVAEYSGRKAAEIVGITYRQLDYWARTALIRPSISDANGSGTRRRYSYRDLLELKVIKNLLDAGIKLESVREAFGYMREALGEDVATANLVISGTHPVLVRSDGELIDLVKRGQGVLNVLPLSGVKDELDAAIVDLFPESGDATGAAREDDAGEAAASEG